MSAKKASEITPERIQKIIAQAGLASRREAEELIASGQVTVNGKTAKLGEKAQFGVDAIKVKGKLIQHTENKVYYLFYKPKNVIAMINEDEEGRPTIKDFTKSIHERVFPIGRMDYSGEGAIILTNDGELAQKISKSNDLIRRYHVKVDRHPTTEDLARLARGGRIEKVSMNPHHIRVVSEYARNSLIEISFQGAGVTEIRKYFENKGFFPEKVVRIGIGHLKADKMAAGELKKIDETSIQALLAQPELAEKLITNIVKARPDNFLVVNGEEQIDRTRKSFTEKTGKPAGEKSFGRKKREDEGKYAENTGTEDRPSRRPARNRPLPAERAAGVKRVSRPDMPAPRFKKDGDRPARGGDRPMRSAGGRGRPSFGSDRPAFDRAPRGAVRGGGRGGDRPAFGDRAPRGGGDRHGRYEWNEPRDLSRRQPPRVRVRRRQRVRVRRVRLRSARPHQRRGAMGHGRLSDGCPV